MAMYINTLHFLCEKGFDCYLRRKIIKSKSNFRLILIEQRYDTAIYNFAGKE